MTAVVVRVYGPLNDFLPRERRQADWPRVVDGHPTVKDLTEGLGVPHPEVDLVLVNGESVAFDRAVRDGDRVAVFPRFTALDVDGLARVRPARPDVTRFVADVHLGTLARRLRLLGLDTWYETTATDADLATLAARERRVLLTRDLGLLKRRAVEYGYFVRDTRPHRQLQEVLARFGPTPVVPFSRCTRCNARLRDVAKADVLDGLPPRVREAHDRFRQCPDCGRLYWEGSHWRRLGAAVRAVTRGPGDAA